MYIAIQYRHYEIFLLIVARFQQGLSREKHTVRATLKRVVKNRIYEFLSSERVPRSENALPVVTLYSPCMRYNCPAAIIHATLRKQRLRSEPMMRL